MKKITALALIGLFLFISCSKDDELEDIKTVNKIVNKQQTGSSSNDLLSDKKYKSTIVELVYVVGFEPNAASIRNFINFLESRTYKPNGIEVVMRSIPSPASAPYTIQEIAAIEDANRTKYNTADQIAVWAFFADGESSSNTSTGVVLGSAYRNTSFVIYEKTVQNLSNSPSEPSRSLLETTVITHEFGHVLGLTNLGAPLQSNHEDMEHEKHCVEKSCLMFWSAETGNGIGDMISGGRAPQLDAQCIADLKANGGK